MEWFSVLWVCLVSVISWKCYNYGWLYCIKWLVVSFVLKWRRFTNVKPNSPLFPSREEEYLEKPRIWATEKSFRRDSMLVFAASQDVWLLMEVVRGRHNSAAARVRLQLGSPISSIQTVLQTSDDRPRACSNWTTDILSLECLEPMRRWRIVFRGRLYCRDEGGKKNSKLVKINLIWTSLCAPHRFTEDSHILTLSDVLAKQPLSHLQLNLDALSKEYEQWGIVWGTVDVAGSITDIHAPSLRRHCWKWPPLPRTSIVGMVNNGTMFSIAHIYGNIRAQLGHARYPDGRVENLIGTTMIDSPILPHKFVREFESTCYSHVIYVVRSEWEQWSEFQWSPARCTFDNRQAVCLILDCSTNMREELPELPLLVSSVLASSDLVLSLHHPVCSNPKVVGGKAASLALLADASQIALRNKVVVPDGFCLTIDAMQLQAQSSKPLNSAVKFLNLISTGQENGNLQEECQHVVNAWLTVPLCAPLLAALTDHVQQDRSYAVRSSAIGEDSADTSAAGQNATVLGCVGLDSVVAAVHKCWSSLYSFQSVQYRRQAGLPVESLMGVVVQEMVEAEAAGVMFTRHPISADPSQLLITANYGLGETVVSGSVEPDTIVVNTENSEHLVIQSTTVGGKESRLAVTDEGTVEIEPVSEEMMEHICLSDPQIIALARVGVILECLFGWPRDVEWAINKGVIYLLQCRPVTSLLTWTQEELLHELDSAILSNEATTTANTGEVLPGATSPLTQSGVLRCADLFMIRKFTGLPQLLWYNNNGLLTSHHHVLLSLYNTLFLGATEKPSMLQKVLEVAVCGHKVGTEEILKIVAARSTPKNILQLSLEYLHIIKQLVVSRWAAKKSQRLGEKFKINYHTFTSAPALYAYLTASYSSMLEAFRLHTRITFAATIWQTILFMILGQGNQDLSEENLQDIARLLVGKQTAISAEIPVHIKELIKLIRTCETWEDLTRLSPEKIPEWLEVNCPTASNKLQDLIHRYAHRNIKELDLMTRTWGLDSTPLLTMIQTTLRSPHDGEPVRAKNEEKTTDAEGQLKSPLKLFNRLMIWCVVGMSSTAAARRETTKDASLRIIHQFRLSYLRLAQLMREEGRLPSLDLVWFSTHYELGLLMRGPNPALLHKICRRQLSWQQWDKLQFPEVMLGLPTPVQFDSHPSISLEEGVQGTLVCPGSVQGRACVLLNISHWHTLQAGDILVTHSTDVGWTPLFPLLSGVVTELGGLISHGAVVAREYGLPCVVGATNATLVFKTGDEIFLDGQSGKVQKVSSTT